MSRGCSDTYLNGKTEDYTHTIYQLSCKADLCNSGDGKTGSEGSHSYLGDKSTIYCPGTDSSSINYISKLSIASCILILLLMWNYSENLSSNFIINRLI